MYMTLTSSPLEIHNGVYELQVSFCFTKGGVETFRNHVFGSHSKYLIPEKCR